MDWIQFFLFLTLLTLFVKPLGLYLFSVLTPEGKTPLDFCLKPLEKFTYRICGIDPTKEQDWKQYLYSMLIFSGISFLFTFAILRNQSFLPLNPEHLTSPSSHLCFNIAVSFLTNTNWQSYEGETTLSYFSQMVGLGVQNFLSPAVGMAIAAAFSRSLSRESKKTLGNFWVDLIRLSYYLFLPLALVFSVFFLSQGVPQNFHPHVEVSTLENGTIQQIVQGPIASQESIKLLGTNGGGFTNADSSHPYENPTPLSNFIQMFCMMLIPAGQTYYFGRQIKNQKHGWAIYWAMLILFAINTFICVHFETKGSPSFHQMGIETKSGSLEGKEQRFGLFGSAFFSTVTTATSTGATNSMLDSFTPIGGLVSMLQIQLGEVIFGGVGSGLYSMLIYVILAIFIAGLIVGRSPEYFGKKLAAVDIKFSILFLLASFLSILGFTSWACMSSWGTSGIATSGPHGFSEILYAFSSAVGNNGSAFAGLASNTPWYNLTLGVAMLFGRFFSIVFVLMLAGSFATKKLHPIGTGTFPLSGSTFVLLLVGVIFLLGGLAFIPAVLMGPILEQFFMIKNILF